MRRFQREMRAWRIEKRDEHSGREWASAIRRLTNNRHNRRLNQGYARVRSQSVVDVNQLPMQRSSISINAERSQHSSRSFRKLIGL